MSPTTAPHSARPAPRSGLHARTHEIALFARAFAPYGDVLPHAEPRQHGTDGRARARGLGAERLRFSQETSALCCSDLVNLASTYLACRHYSAVTCCARLRLAKMRVPLIDTKAQVQTPPPECFLFRWDVGTSVCTASFAFLLPSNAALIQMLLRALPLPLRGSLGDLTVQRGPRGLWAGDAAVCAGPISPMHLQRYPRASTRSRAWKPFWVAALQH